jgi:hypothetical protein
VAVRRKRGQLLLEVGGVALWTFRLLIPQEDSFKTVTALGAKVFENWHNCSDHPHSLATLACHNGESVVVITIIDVASQIKQSH